ncbi:MAG TPA: hypothetical protein VMG36_05330 [Thermoplasmata archaeon]|nr:hypothetical protein [Thermoplasmata archaeon]
MPPSARRYRTIRLCSGGGGFEALPEPPGRLDLVALRKALEQRGTSVVDARVMLLVLGAPEVTVSAGGRVLIKTKDAAAAARRFAELQPLLG